VKNIQDRYNKYRENLKKNLNNKLANERDKYTLSKEKHLQELKQEEELQEARVFKKYEGYVSSISFYNSFL